MVNTNSYSNIITKFSSKDSLPFSIILLGALEHFSGYQDIANEVLLSNVCLDISACQTSPVPLFLLLKHYVQEKYQDSPLLVELLVYFSKMINYPLNFKIFKTIRYVTGKTF